MTSSQGRPASCCVNQSLQVFRLATQLLLGEGEDALWQKAHPCKRRCCLECNTTQQLGGWSWYMFDKITIAGILKMAEGLKQSP